jgi:hypothetical protein
MSKKPKIYAINIPLAAVAVGASGIKGRSVLKIVDGDFEGDALAFSAFDANGAIVHAPNIDLEISKGGRSVANAFNVASVSREATPIFKLPERIQCLRTEELMFDATPQPGSTVVRLNIAFLGRE